MRIFAIFASILTYFQTKLNSLALNWIHSILQLITGFRYASFSRSANLQDAKFPLDALHFGVQKDSRSAKKCIHSTAFLHMKNSLNVYAIFLSRLIAMNSAQFLCQQNSNGFVKNAWNCHSCWMSRPPQNQAAKMSGTRVSFQSD